MVRPSNLRTKIFLDSGDPMETKEALTLLGFLDGQTTNPSLFAKNPNVAERLKRGEKFSREEVLDFYRRVVLEISALIPEGSVSVEVYADAQSTEAGLVEQARTMFSWIPNPAPEQVRYGAGVHIKLPITIAGLAVAERVVQEGMRVNMTLCFTEKQAAAVYTATRGAVQGQVFLSPFVGRLDDRGENGMDLIANCLRLYKGGDKHVEVLTASVRTIDHFLYALAMQSPIITAPLSVLKEWKSRGMPVPGGEYQYDAKGKASIPYLALDLIKPWQSFDIHHELTDMGIEKFASDWNALIQ